MRWLLPATAVGIGVLGGLGWGLGTGARAAWSFVGGYLIALAVVAFATVAVIVIGQLSPSFTMLAAMSNYLLTVLAFVLVLRSVDRDQIDVAAASTGLLASVLPYMWWQFRRAWVRAPSPQERAAAGGKSTLS